MKPKVREQDFYYYSGGMIRIIIGGSRDFIEKEKELIFSVVRRIIPCELRLKMRFADSSGTYKLESKYKHDYGFIP